MKRAAFSFSDRQLVTTCDHPGCPVMIQYVVEGPDPFWWRHIEPLPEDVAPHAAQMPGALAEAAARIRLAVQHG